MKKSSVVLVVLLFSVTTALSQTSGEIRGQFKNEKGEPVEFAAVVVFSGETHIAATTTNEKGFYVIKPINAGTYKVEVRHLNYQNLIINNVVVSNNSAKYLDETMLAQSHEFKPIIIEGKGDAIIDKGKISSGGSIKAQDIKTSPMRDVRDFVATVPGIVQRDEGGSINIRGSREGGTQYIVDGIKVIGGLSIPKAAIEEITVLTGGIPAQFGDATGGIVIITTKSFIGR
ncbi:MAG: TonB-dependent receptor plug domain-containing protein [Bacteroidia bacterium]